MVPHYLRHLIQDAIDSVATDAYTIVEKNVVDLVDVVAKLPVRDLMRIPILEMGYGRDSGYTPHVFSLVGRKEYNFFCFLTS